MDLIDHCSKPEIMEDFDLLVANQQRRDKGTYHTTVMNVMEYNETRTRIGLKIGMKLYMDKLKEAFSVEINDIKMLGIGKAESKGNITYFVVIKSETLDGLRKSFGLAPRDLHITIGFDKKDVFGQPKDETSLI
jgi:hypothetical protein